MSIKGGAVLLALLCIIGIGVSAFELARLLAIVSFGRQIEAQIVELRDTRNKHGHRSATVAWQDQMGVPRRESGITIHKEFKPRSSTQMRIRFVDAAPWLGIEIPGNGDMGFMFNLLVISAVFLGVSAWVLRT